VYWHAIQQCISASKWTFDALTVTCDYEMALLNSAKAQFPGVTMVCCLFHLKQAIRRKMKYMKKTWINTYNPTM
jgi:hypothetical protein